MSRGLKQDLKLKTTIADDNVIIEEQLIGKLKGLKLNLEFTSGTLDTDIKSLKKAARQGIADELIRRTKEIINEKQIVFKDNYKIYWKDGPIAKIKKGKNYLYPEIEIIADEALDPQTKNELTSFLNHWLKDYILEQLRDLINLTKLQNDNKYLRALAYQLYESNGVLKRINVEEIVKAISKEERKQFRKLGIKIGRYHIFLPRMLKPKAVELRILLWKFYNNILKDKEIPKSGLNFLFDDKKKFNSKFLLLCGFERFGNFYVRVDILEKLFLKIIENTKNGKFKINPDMMNLLGCSKENFYQLMSLMNYRKENNNVEIFSYRGQRKNKNKIKFIDNKSNPFKKLMRLNLK